MPAAELPWGPQGWTPDLLPDLKGKLFLITGATTGCGFQATKLLLSRGARVIMLNRCPKKSAAAVEALSPESVGQEQSSSPKLSFVLMDLADLSSVRKAAAELLAGPLAGADAGLAALICNAAVSQVPKQKLTKDGHETHLQVNYLGHFLLCGLLHDRLCQAQARVVCVGSNGYKMNLKQVHFEDFNFDKGYDPMKVYNHSKFCLTMFCFELQRRNAAKRRAEGDSAALGGAFMCHPGASKTDLIKDEGTRCTVFLVKCLMATPGLFQSAERGSYPQVALATDESEAFLAGRDEPKMYGPTSGKMEFKGPVGVNPLETAVLDGDSAARLWTDSAKLVGLTWA